MKRTVLPMLLAIALLCAACAPGAAPGAADATAPVFVPPVVGTTTPAAVEASDAAAEVENDDADAVAAAADEPFELNGVTLPFPRSQAMVMDRYNQTIFDSFNPFIPNGVAYDSGFYFASVEYLWYLNTATGEIVPWLAESYEYNDDFTTLTLTLREGVTWNDGEPFTADDVVFTANLLKSDPTLFGPGDVRFWDNVYAADDQTVMIEMSQPRPRQHNLFIIKVGNSGFLVVPEHIWADEDPHTFKNFPPVTTGPYMLDRAYEEQKLFVWQRNENYWNRDAYYPEPQYVIYRVGTQDRPEVQLAEAKANKMDMMRMQWDNYVQIQDEITHFNNVNYLDPCPRGAWFNAAQPHVEHPEFRRALSMLMNREKWAQNLWAPASRPAKAFWADYQHMEPFVNYEANDKWGVLNFDPEGALALMAELGYTQDGDTLLDPNGEPVTLEVTTPVGPGGREYTMAQDFVAELQAIGIDASLKHLESGVFFNNVDSGDFQIGFWWLCGAFLDPLELFEAFTCDNVTPVGEVAAQGNEMRVCDPEMDEVLAQLGQVAPDDPAAAELYMEAYDLFMQNLPGTPLIETIYSTFHNTTYWDGMLSEDNVYTVPLYHWAQILFVFLNVTPAAE